ncbi:IclR family transcriptional regulator [Nesterenkonia ebinurensis]|uniref:IclR family transcriptional regulator n=1 Tax=Nesterenkonia ebinurensis TaxID=2608252 RepID=UPI00123CFF50|nr:IclR family transcriptional regulator [Nesterenkonia ebinurensis]
MSGSNGVNSVNTALRVLEGVAKQEAVGVTELSKQLGIPKSSVQRMLYTLQEAGWVRETGEDVTRWTLTSLMLRLTGDRQRGLRRAVLPVMEALRDKTQETIHLAIEEFETAVIIERLVSPQPVRANVDLGQGAPLLASANGKAIISTWRDDDVRTLIAKGLKNYTSATISNERDLWKQIDFIREKGYATQSEEWREGVAAVSVPLINGNRAEGAISISTPAYRMTQERQEEYGELLMAAISALEFTAPSSSSE